jgi:hypothetical protein
VSHPPAGLTWHGYLVQLLHIASSIEHALMVQYLFAAYSLNDGVESSEFRKKVVLWRNLILSIAKEEMGHLLTVQNVLCLLGGPVELVRENFPWDSEFYPFEFRLERLTVGCLACYLYAEMSNGVPDLPQELKPLAQSAEKAAQRHIQRRSEGIRKPLPDLQRPGLHQIGILYQRIIEILADRHMLKAAREIRAKIANTQAPGHGALGSMLSMIPPASSASVLSRLFRSCRARTREPQPHRRRWSGHAAGGDRPFVIGQKRSTLLRLRYTSYDCCDRFLRC